MRYWDDIEVGERFSSPGRTITEADVVMFGALTGDFMPFHMDEEFAKDTIYGSRIAHGLLGLSYMQGVITWVPTGIASMGSLGWTVDFRAPIRIGDTVHCDFEIAGKRPSRKLDRGVVFVACRLLNQDGQLVQEGEHRRMVRRQVASSASLGTL
jgi:acyl dehydratase